MNKKTFDFISVLGFVIGLSGLGLGYYLEGGSFSALFGISSMLIIFGGTIGSVVITMTNEDIKKIPKTLKKIFESKTYDYQTTIDNLCEWTKISRKDGITALDDVLQNVEDPFIKRGIEYILEGNDYEAVKDLLETEVEATMDRHEKGAKPYEQAGGFAPTMGVIGAVMGLVVVLGNLGESGINELGQGIAVAFTATMLGIGSANVVLLPFAEKLKNKSDEEILYKTIIVEGILGIQTGKNPTMLRRKMLAFLPESKKQEMDKGRDEQ